nr:MAG: ORF1 [TTV-like mini virus]
MPYYYRRPIRRFRRYWRRRPRTTFRRRRLWRRRRFWVRKRKLKKITLKQWQPATIHKLTVKGQYPLFAGTSDRIGNDYTAYSDEIAPKDYPGGGLYGITVFTLQGLYELHQKARNWWTTTNCNLPLIRYSGCTIKLYYSNTVDYVSVIVNCGELKANEQMFQSCQPAVLMLNTKKKVMTCRNYKKSRRAYKKWFIQPPALLLNKWYFQKEIANYPLFMILSSAMSLDRYYMSSTSVSETTGFQSLNTDFFTYHNWKGPSSEPYKPNDRFYLFGIGGHTSFDAAKPENLILLGNTTDYQQGLQIGEMNGTDYKNKVEEYMKKKKNWGNPFKKSWLDAPTDEGLFCLIEVQATETLLNKLKNLDNTKTLKQQTPPIIEPTKPFTVACRYNPQADLGHNATFVTRITADNTTWHEPADQHLVTKGFPLWLLNFGWEDFLKKSSTPQRLDTDYVQVIVSDYISPKDLTYYVPLDWWFLDDKSPHSDHIKPFDYINWHPKFNFQRQSISHIIQTGPATTKLPPDISAEAHFTYKFHFKVGGCPPKMDEVCDPAKQPQYPQPGNILSSILLQNPSAPIQYYLSSFDQRRDMLTKRAAKRIKEDKDFKETIFTPTGKTLLDLRLPSPQTTSSEDSSTEEENEEETQSLIHRHRRKQRKLQHGILKLLQLIQK